ncbi:MAG: outer membrane beta-barrel protein [Proteobacteria bacterium]|nr:outer membrane beta-barrel protein [Pseudomonadota bacterium]
MNAIKRQLTYALIIGCSFFYMTADAAFYDSRKGKFEFYLMPTVTNSEALEFDNGSSSNLNRRTGFGFGMGYNVNSHIELSLDFTSSNGSYTLTAIPELPTAPGTEPLKSTGNLYTSSINFGFTFNLLSTPFTPYITGTLGSTYIDTGIYTGEVGTGCYWYPYWGYVCGPVARTYTSNEINYGAALGLRYDFSRKLFIKGDIGQNYLDVDNSNIPAFTTYRFIFGFMF